MEIKLHIMTPFQETVAQIKFLAQDRLIGKFFDINQPVGF